MASNRYQLPADARKLERRAKKLKKRRDNASSETTEPSPSAFNGITIQLPAYTKTNLHKETTDTDQQLAEATLPKFSGKVCDLPAEVVLAITDFLSPGDAVLFGLTCKNLHSIIINESKPGLIPGGRKRIVERLNRETSEVEQLAFLGQLEKDDPKWLLCTVCEKLHRLGRDEQNLCELIPRYGRTKECQRAQQTVKLGYGSELHRVALDLVLRHTSLGPAYGIPSDKLSLDRSHKRFGLRRLDIRQYLKARVVLVQPDQAHLFVMNHFSLEFDLRKDIRTQVEDSQMMACIHQGPFDLGVIHTAIRSLQSRGGLTFYVVTNCRHCPTDIQVSVSRPSVNDNFPTVQVTAMRDLGPRGSHNSRIWRSQTSYISSPIFDRTSCGYGTKSLIEHWIEAGAKAKGSAPAVEVSRAS